MAFDRNAYMREYYGRRGAAYNAERNLKALQPTKDELQIAMEWMTRAANYLDGKTNGHTPSQVILTPRIRKIIKFAVMSAKETA